MYLPNISEHFTNIFKKLVKYLFIYLFIFFERFSTKIGRDKIYITNVKIQYAIRMIIYNVYQIALKSTKSFWRFIN